MKEVKINVPDGYEIDKDKSTFENIVFKEKTKLPNTLGEYEAEWFNGILNEYKFRHASRALKALYDLRNCYRQGWEPDWNDATEHKWIIHFKGTDIHICREWLNNEFLSFEEEETAELFLNNFRDLIEQAKPLMG